MRDRRTASAARCLLLAALAGCGGSAGDASGGAAGGGEAAEEPRAPDPPPGPVAPPAPAPFLQPVPASATVAIEMVGVPGKVLADGAVLPPFWIAKTELTWDAYDVYRLCEDLPYRLRDAAIDGETRPTRPYGAPDYGFGHEGWPAMSIAREAAEAYCAWLAEKTGRAYRLPTESEWERACTAAGDPLAAGIDAVAWTFDNANDQTHPVGKKAPNALGLHDMLGNVGEWCRTDDGIGHVLRGGSYFEMSGEVTPAFRAPQLPSWQARDPQIPKSVWWLSDGPFVGFRPLCAMAETAPAQKNDQPPGANPGAAPASDTPRPGDRQ
ncbi:MAG: SUMF1/EgtB/PvdO family nonheme iron enzyme [Planctomycetota bacterium]